jgi:L-lactate permease
MGLIFGGADRNSPEAAAGVEDEVVAVTVSPGLGDAETEANGFAHKREFGEFSATLGWLGVALVGGGTAGYVGKFPALSQRARQGRGTRETLGTRTHL